MKSMLNTLAGVVLALLVYSYVEDGLPSLLPHADIDRVTYVYEKDKNPVPVPVQAALDRLNVDGKVIAAAVDISSVEDGTGEIPDQYKVAIATAKEKGIPILVVQAGDKVTRTVAEPKTAKDVEEAL